jgi:hypothetical protein
MTAFEILTIVFYAVVVMIGYLICRGISTVTDNQQETDSNLRKMDAGLDKRLEDISQQVDNIEDNILDDLRDIRLADKFGKTSPNVPTPLPCYAPNGICTNPQRDCINCPKIGTGGTWSTNTAIKAEGEMFQEKFNDSKED